MKTFKLTNKTLPNCWSFDPEKAQFFEGKFISFTDSDRLLLGTELDPGYKTENLFFLEKSVNWVKEFASPTLPSLFVQVTSSQAKTWLFNHGYDPQNPNYGRYLRANAARRKRTFKPLPGKEGGWPDNFRDIGDPINF